MMVYNISQSPGTPSSCKHKRRTNKYNNSSNKMLKQNKNQPINKRTVKRITRTKPDNITRSNKEFLRALGFKI